MNCVHRYWMVHNMTGRPPYFTHKSEADAVNEAKRLASKHPGEIFAVLASVDAYLIPAPEPVRIRIDDIPF